MSPPPPKKGVKATVHKVFILDMQGGLAGEYAPDENCVVEFGDFLAAAPEGGLADGQTIFLGEWRATAVEGEWMGLVVISKGQLGPEEVGWAKAALVAAEAQLSPETEEAPAAPPGPDKAVMENLASALEKREAALAEREKAAEEAEQRAYAAAQEAQSKGEAERDELRAKLAEAEKERDAARQELEAERAKMRAEMERIAQAPKPAPTQVDPKLEAMRKQTEADRKYLQKYALDLIAREEKARDAALAADETKAKLSAAEEEIASLRAEVEAAKAEASQPSPEMEAQRRELEMRVKILQEKATELLRRDEKLRERERLLQERLKQVRA